MGAAEIEVFLTHLAVQRNVSAATQSQALAALLLLYKEVLKLNLPWLQGIVRAKKPGLLVLSRDEVAELLTHLQGVQWVVPICCMARACVCWRRSGRGRRLVQVLGRKAPVAASIMVPRPSGLAQPPFNRLVYRLARLVLGKVPHAWQLQALHAAGEGVQVVEAFGQVTAVGLAVDDQTGHFHLR